MTETNEPDEILVTRDQIVQIVREELGIPITKSAIEKAAMLGIGPEPAARYGKAFLYRKGVALAWARTLISPVNDSATAARRNVQSAA